MGSLSSPLCGQLPQRLAPLGRGGSSSSLPFQCSLPAGFLLGPVQSWEVAEPSPASVCRNRAAQMGQTPAETDQTLAETGLRSSLRSQCPGLSSGLRGSLSQAQVLPQLPGRCRFPYGAR